MKKLAGQKELLQCPLCGNKCDLKDAMKACQACSFLKKCDVIMCPRCHYEFSKPSN